MHELVLSQRSSGSGERWLHLPEKGHAPNASIRILQQRWSKTGILAMRVGDCFAETQDDGPKTTHKRDTIRSCFQYFIHSGSWSRRCDQRVDMEWRFCALISWCWLEDSWTRRISADDGLLYTDVHLTRSASRPDQHSCGPGLG